MRPTVRTTAAALAAFMLVALGAFAAGVRAGDDASRVRSLERDRARHVQRAHRLQVQRDRLRAERDSLEARLAAARAPAICPQPFLSTGDTHLIDAFDVVYPCGWSVLWQPEPPASEEERGGLRVGVLLLSRLPISLAPGGKPVADIELADWSDDTAIDGDALPAFDEWLAQERTTFASKKEERATAGSSAAVKLSGTISINDVSTPAIVVVWEFVTRDGRRHIARVFASSPGAEAQRALTRMLASFRVSPA